MKTFDNVEEVSEVNPLFKSSPWTPGELELVEAGDDSNTGFKILFVFDDFGDYN